jgi:hypothetical protein
MTVFIFAAMIAAIIEGRKDDFYWFKLFAITILSQIYLNTL